MKITAAHDFNDFKVGKRHNLPMLYVLDGRARGAMAERRLGRRPKYRGLDRFDGAQDRSVEDHRSAGPARLLAKIKNTHHGAARRPLRRVIEPMLTEQWYVNAEELAKPADQGGRERHDRFVPKPWEKTYFDWMRNIQPWCISRQLWWGHRIPAWYGPDGTMFVAKRPKPRPSARRATHYGRDEALRQDEDVLDTWFSSALWPFSTWAGRKRRRS